MARLDLARVKGCAWCNLGCDSIELCPHVFKRDAHELQSLVATLVTSDDTGGRGWNIEQISDQLFDSCVGSSILRRWRDTKMQHALSPSYYRRATRSWLHIDRQKDRRAFWLFPIFACGCGLNDGEQFIGHVRLL